ncbi:HTH-type transcriptional regulator iscR [Listeria grayi]|nr:Rrf2 family transcriptional regulator [Listeria grayi]EUJ29863.1 transcriptional regulator BadM/Rrf2 family protein [Listeria grayi FSL F6-1183]MBC1920709.1 Rrf2 family transcriptional regulator [Listeria grayi]VEI34286.1 HTH-type transcriptional regulator iscR [Listeria grayi]
MKLKNGIEQTICILIMLETQDKAKPLKSYTISERLGISDSYLKKVMRQLVVAGLVTSEAGKDGGFILAKKAEDFTMLDIYEAIEGKESFIHSTNLAAKVFLYEDIIEAKESEILNVFFEAEELFKIRLGQYKFSQLLMNTEQINKGVDWKEIPLKGK